MKNIIFFAYSVDDDFITSMFHNNNIHASFVIMLKKTGQKFKKKTIPKIFLFNPEKNPVKSVKQKTYIKVSVSTRKKIRRGKVAKTQSSYFIIHKEK